MGPVLKHRGRAVSEADVSFIRSLIASTPEASRRQLSRLLCEAWDMKQANGAPRDMVCRGMMLALDRAGHITLPAVKCRPRNPFLERKRPEAIGIDQSPMAGSLRELGPLHWVQVRRSVEEKLFNGLIEAHHYLGYTQPVGEHLKYLVYAGQRVVACLAWSSAPRHLAPRDKFIGWSQEVRRRNVRLVAYNTRYLILPWVTVPHLASHVLGKMARMLPAEWQRVYGHPVYFAETFVDIERYRGTCYRAANWVVLGETTGRGNNAATHAPTRPKKQVLGLPLHAHFRRMLQEAS